MEGKTEKQSETGRELIKVRGGEENGASQVVPTQCLSLRHHQNIQIVTDLLDLIGK